MAAASLLLRTIPLLRHRLYRYSDAAGLLRRPWCTAVDSTRPENDLSPSEKTIPAVSSLPPRHPRWSEDPDFRKWEDKEAEIMRDIEPVWSLAKEILHSDLYVDGERLSVKDEKVVVENLLAYHPHSDDKIGPGLDYIMVDRHPQFRNSRCLFVVRTDGGWIDFSYQKCLRAYIRSKYPMHAERFIREHFKRGSG